MVIFCRGQCRPCYSTNLGTHNHRALPIFHHCSHATPMGSALVSCSEVPVYMHAAACRSAQPNRCKAAISLAPFAFRALKSRNHLCQVPAENASATILQAAATQVTDDQAQRHLGATASVSCQSNDLVAKCSLRPQRKLPKLSILFSSVSSARWAQYPPKSYSSLHNTTIHALVWRTVHAVTWRRLMSKRRPSTRPA